MKCACPPRRTHRVTLQRPVFAADAYADAAGTWTTVDKRWMRVITRGGREFRQSDQIQADVNHIFETNSDSLTRTIGPTWRLLWDGKIFNVTAAFDVDGLRRTVRILATEAA